MTQYKAQSHSAPHVAVIDGTTTYGTGPGETMAALAGDAHGVVSGIWMPTKLDADGQPNGLRYFPASTGSVG
jgi:hypothetical protein